MYKYISLYLIRYSAIPVYIEFLGERWKVILPNEAQKATLDGMSGEWLVVERVA